MTSTARTFDDLLRRARAVPIEHEIGHRSIQLRGGIDKCGPCPVCGGVDRFAIHIRKQVFNCRGCNLGGDVIALVQHLDGIGFQDAVHLLAGEEPRRSVVYKSQPAIHIDHKQNEIESYEREQHKKAAWLWSKRQPIHGTVGENYARGARRITCPLPLTLGFLPPYNERPPRLIAAFGFAPEPEPDLIAAPAHVDSVHIIRLLADGSDRERHNKAKTTTGSSPGLPVVIAPPNDLLALSIVEGIEEALTLLQDNTGVGIWAACGADRMPALANSIPHYIEVVTIHANDDKHEKTEENKGRKRALELAYALEERNLKSFEERELAAREGRKCEQKYLFNAEIRLQGVRV
jgi:hypothetical protein